jgi:hypothetical protein
MHPCVKRQDDVLRGRHLVTSRSVPAKTLLFMEQPLVALQSLGNAHEGALVCRHCRCFVGGPSTCLQLASGQTSRQDILESHQIKENSRQEQEEGEEATKKLFETNHPHQIIPCRNECGEVFCSRDCEIICWENAGHCLLCTGSIPDGIDDTDDDNEEAIEAVIRNDQDDPPLNPLLRYKMLAMQTNEILILVADWIAAVTCQYFSELLRLHYQPTDDNAFLKDTLDFNNINALFPEETAVQVSPALSRVLKPYTDFTLNKWSSIAADPLMAQPMGVTKAKEVRDSIQCLCGDASKLLREIWIVASDNVITMGETTTTETHTALWKKAVQECAEALCHSIVLERIVGSFEQNAIGIRARHPLCIDVLDCDFRKIPSNHSALVECFLKAGYFDENGDESEDEGSDQTQEEQDDQEDVKAEGEAEHNETISQDYTVTEVASFVADIYNIGEEVESSGGKEEENEDLNTLFTPLDGTAMFSLTCKMNHSCRPNAMVRYVNGWGSTRPLVLQCVALRDIDEGEELCISYIDGEEHLDVAERRQVLENYGFHCSCDRCVEEKKQERSDKAAILTTDMAGSNVDEMGVFGSDSDSDEDDQDKLKVKLDPNAPIGVLHEDDSIENTISVKRIAMITPGNETLGSVPRKLFASCAAFVLSSGGAVLRKLPQDETADHEVHSTQERILLSEMSSMVQSLRSGDHGKWVFHGMEGEIAGLELLQTKGSWPNATFREAYHLFAVSSAFGKAQDGSMLEAMQYLDKAIILGFQRSFMPDFINYVEYFAQTSSSVVPSAKFQASACVLPRYHQVTHLEQAVNEGMTKSLDFAIQEIDVQDSTDLMWKETISDRKPLLCRQYAATWKALDLWR